MSSARPIQVHNDPSVQRSHFAIGSLLKSEAMTSNLLEYLDRDRFSLTSFHDGALFLDFVDRSRNDLDCLMFEASPELSVSVVDRLRDRAILLPAVVLEPSSPFDSTEDCNGVSSEDDRGCWYNAAEQVLRVDNLEDCNRYIERAIAQFLQLQPDRINAPPSSIRNRDLHARAERNLTAQQYRLAEKLRARLGYLGVYYKRDSKYFLRHLSKSEREAFIQQFKDDYLEIVLSYFSKDGDVDRKIDSFVNVAFFADVSVAQVVETHMMLVDEFAKQLRLEGRSEEILLDYRLTLIDVISHLCEMYRRSIPRED